MAEDKELNLGSLLAAKQYETSSRKKREDKQYIKEVLTDFGSRFMSSLLIDQPAAMRKEFIQANLQDAKFQAAIEREKIKHKTAYVADRKEDLDFVNSFSTPDIGFYKLAEKNFLATEEGKKYIELGADDAYLDFPTEVTDSIIKSKKDFLTSEGERLKNLYQPYIDNPDLIIEQLTAPDRLSKQVRDSLYAKTYADAEAQFGTFNFIKNLFGANVATHSRYAYLQDEIEARIEAETQKIKEIADFNTFADGKKASETTLTSPFALGASYKNRFTKMNTAFKDMSTKNAQQRAKELFTVPPKRILVLEDSAQADGELISGALLTSEQRTKLREDNKTNQLPQNIFFESTTEGYIYGTYDGDELRKRKSVELGLNPDLDPTQQVKVRAKTVDKDGNIRFVEQNIGLNEALIADVTLGAEFFRHKDLTETKDMTLVQQNDVGFNYERQYVKFLVESGNIWYDRNGVLHYDRPSLARDLTQANDVSKGFNEADVINARLMSQLDKESLTTEDFFNQSIDIKINTIRNSNMPPDLLEEKLGQLENLNTEKDKQQEFLINLVMPPKDLRGTIVKYSNHYFSAGELTDAQKEALYNRFIMDFNDNEDFPLLKTIFQIK